MSLVPDEAIESMDDLNKFLRSAGAKKLSNQTRQRHECVLGFLNLQYSTKGAPLEDTRRATLSLLASKTSGKGTWFAKQIVKWEKSWIASRVIPEGQKGSKGNLQSWLRDEGLLIFVREWIHKEKERKCLICERDCKRKQVLTQEQISQPTSSQRP